MLGLAAVRPFVAFGDGWCGLLFQEVNYGCVKCGGLVEHDEVARVVDSGEMDVGEGCVGVGIESGDGFEGTLCLDVGVKDGCGGVDRGEKWAEGCLQVWEH